MHRLAPETLMLIKFLQDCHIKREAATVQAMNNLFKVSNRQYYNSKFNSAIKELERQNMFFEARWGRDADGNRRIVAYEPIKKNAVIQKMGQKHFDLVERSTRRVNEIVSRALPELDFAEMAEEEQIQTASTLYRIQEHKETIAPTHLEKVEASVRQRHATGQIGEDHKNLMKQLFAGFNVEF